MLEYIEILDSLDKSALLALNGNANPYWDKFMWIITGRFVWIPIIVFFLKYFFNKGYKDAILILLFIILTITLCDQISSSFFKPFFERLRPARQPELTDLVNIVNGYRGGRYGFISSHAANAFGFTVFTSLVF